MFDYKYETNVNSAFIIRIDGNEVSETMARRCAESCEKVGMPYEFFSAVDGTSGSVVAPWPRHQILDLVKVTNKTLTSAEVACMLSHFLLWVKCVELDEPIVILEHDAVMVQPYLVHPFFNIISYLGCIEQANGWQPQFPLPPHGQLNENFRFILRAHAYSVDPMIARQLVAKLIKAGVFTSADVMIRADEFAIVQHGFFAHDLPGETTIPGRPEKNMQEHLMDINNKIETS
jgi:hypothetical protein